MKRDICNPVREEKRLSPAKKKEIFLSHKLRREERGRGKIPHAAKKTQIFFLLFHLSLSLSGHFFLLFFFFFLTSS